MVLQGKNNCFKSCYKYINTCKGSDNKICTYNNVVSIVKCNLEREMDISSSEIFSYGSAKLVHLQKNERIT